MQRLPIDDIMAHLLTEVGAARRLVLTAPPGSGKSTRVPPALLGLGAGSVLLLQPRRVAARSLAARIASERGWRLGEEVGYQVRFERVGSRNTRLWVMTEGTLTRRLQDDPYLEGVQAVVLDEFHERSLNSDLALAWLAELRRTVRPELALVVMSATMDAAPVARFLDGAPLLDAGTPPHPVALRHLPSERTLPLGGQVASAVTQALGQEDCGDVLVFLPGVGEIRACADALTGCAAEVLPLHGRLSLDEQERALRPGPRQRVILSTNVAETSLTIPGVRTVIDSGLVRVSRFDPDRGLDTLVTEDISQAAAAQRAGRAGRTAPGRCLRLWPPAADLRRRAYTDPEIARVDLAPVVLLLKAWHGDDVTRFPWFEAPAPERLAHAEELLAALGASARAGAAAALTARGRRIAELPVHPRLGRLILDALDAGAPALGCSLAALLSGAPVRSSGSGPRHAREVAPPSMVDAREDLAALARAAGRGFPSALRGEGFDPGALSWVRHETGTGDDGVSELPDVVSGRRR